MTYLPIKLCVGLKYTFGKLKQASILGWLSPAVGTLYETFRLQRVGTDNRDARSSSLYLELLERRNSPNAFQVTKMEGSEISSNFKDHLIQ